MGKLITQSFWGMHWTPIQWQKSNQMSLDVTAPVTWQHVNSCTNLSFVAFTWHQICHLYFYSNVYISDHRQHLSLHQCGHSSASTDNQWPTTVCCRDKHSGKPISALGGFQRTGCDITGCIMNWALAKLKHNSCLKNDLIKTFLHAVNSFFLLSAKELIYFEKCLLHKNCVPECPTM